MERRLFKRGAAFAALLLVAALALGVAPSVFADDTAGNKSAATDAQLKAKAERIRTSRVTQEEREIAAARMKLMKDSAQSAASSKRSLAAVAPAPGPGGIPDYFGSTPNWAYSPLLRKFVDGLPGSGPGEREQPRAVPLGRQAGHDHVSRLRLLRDRAARVHASSCTRTCPPTTLRGYVQVNKGTDSARQQHPRAGSHPLPRPDHLRHQGPSGPRQVHQQAPHRRGRRPLHPRRHERHGRRRGPRRRDVHAEPRDAAPPRRPDPVDQRRHAAPVDHARRRRHPVPRRASASRTCRTCPTPATAR